MRPSDPATAIWLQRRDGRAAVAGQLTAAGRRQAVVAAGPAPFLTTSRGWHGRRGGDLQATGMEAGRQGTAQEQEEREPAGATGASDLSRIQASGALATRTSMWDQLAALGGVGGPRAHRDMARCAGVCAGLDTLPVVWM